MEQLKPVDETADRVHSEPMISELLKAYPKILSECAVAEPLSRQPGIELHATLFNTPLIYGPDKSREALEKIYENYLRIAEEAALPLLLTAPTWRLDAQRVREAGVPASINSDAVTFLLQLRDRFNSSVPVLVGALLGPANDCYSPELALTADEAKKFHTAQVRELSETDCDFLLAQTIPAVSEASGLAQIMADSGKPYIVSFCTGTDGRVLDGSSLPEAMAKLDELTLNTTQPVGYFVNCTHPDFHQYYKGNDLDRLIGIQANGSSKDVRSLDQSAKTVMDAVDRWSESMLRLHEQHQVPILGGCCGTSAHHMKALTHNNV